MMISRVKARSASGGLVLFGVALVVALGWGTLLRGAEGGWTDVRWHDEDARQADSGGWRAIVSLERGRLVHFGPSDSSENLLFAPPTRDDPHGWGGHRVWLGPQAEWAAVWPPPPAWEQSAAETVAQHEGVLELIMPESGGGWARLARTYSWTDDGLACGVRLNGGSHSAQVIQIMQVRASAEVRVGAKPDEATPEGFVVLQIGRKDQVRRVFRWPAGVAREVSAGELVLRPSGVIEKLAFAPQPLRAKLLGCELMLGPTVQEGEAVGEIDDGFTTQVYLGRTGVPFLELEQLSSRFAAGEDGSATIVLSGRRP